MKRRQYLTFNLTLSFACVLFIAACGKKPAPAADAGPSAPVPATQESVPAPASAAELSAEQISRLVRPHSPVLGPVDAPVTLVEFLDPACEACRAFAPVVKQVMFLYPKEVRVVVRFADFHEGSADAIRLLLAARRQGRFEPMLAALFEGQDQWAAHHRPDVEQAWKIAAANGLDITRARRDAAAPEVDAVLAQEAEDIVELQVTRTPTFFVNGKPLEGFGPEPLLKLVSQEVQAASASPAR
jgi:protein-disulfide isomerase